MKSVFAALAVCLLAPELLASSNGPPLDLASRAKGAQTIVIASVSDVQTSLTHNQHGDQVIISHVMLAVSETLKGAESSVLSVDVEGGTVGDLTLRVSDMPELKRGERAVFFLDRAAPDRHVPHRRGLGVLKLDPEDRIQGTSMPLTTVKAVVASVKR